MRRMLMGTVLLGSAIAILSHEPAPVLATPSSGFTATTLALGRFGNIDMNNHVSCEVLEKRGLTSISIFVELSI